MDHDRILAIRVEGMRSLADVSLDLGELTILIGANGSGKSSIVEACEILRKIGSESGFLNKLYEEHGGPGALVRAASDTLRFTVDMGGSQQPRLRYTLRLKSFPPFHFRLADESIGVVDDGGHHRVVLHRHGVEYRLMDPDTGTAVGEPCTIDIEASVLQYEGRKTDSVGNRIVRALQSIEVHPPAEMRAKWAGGPEAGARSANIVQTAKRVEPGGRNLPNVYFDLKSQPNFHNVLEDLCLGLGPDVEDVTLEASPAGGQIALGLRIRGIGNIPAFALSDGQIAYLTLVAITNMRRSAPPSLVVFDEPDLHAHPGLAVRIAGLVESCATRFPVLATTQSDTFLDALAEPISDVVLCELDEHRATIVKRPAAIELRAWLERFEGLGEVRRQGYERLAFSAMAGQASDAK